MIVFSLEEFADRRGFDDGTTFECCIQREDMVVDDQVMHFFNTYFMEVTTSSLST
jgi:hypothetical protein